MKRAKRALLGRTGGPIRIACVNRSGADLRMKQLTAALQKFYDKHFLPVWGYAVKLYNTQKPKPSDWQLVYYKHPDQKGVKELGRHQLTRGYQPISKVFVEKLSADEPVSLAASHELFEMVIDPLANLWAQKSNRTLYAYEVCDAVEEDKHGSLMQDGMRMSNFVYPAWFEPIDHPPGTKFDHLGTLKEPFSMNEGGYVIKKVDGKKVTKQFSSDKKKRRFAKEVRHGHRSEFRAGKKHHTLMRRPKASR